MNSKKTSFLQKILLISAFVLISTISPSKAASYPFEVHVDDDYIDGGFNDGYTWGYDAFDNLIDALNIIAGNGTIYVADGVYEYDTTINITKPGITITGPTPINMSNLPMLRNYNCESVFSIEADNISIIGLALEHNQSTTPADYCYTEANISIGAVSNSTIRNNDIAGGSTGISFDELSTSGLISNNNIHDNHDNGIDIWNGTYTINNNTIYNNTWGIGMACNTDSCGGTYNLANSNISGNKIHDNDNGGIIYSAGNQTTTVNIGPNNEIYDQDVNIWINGNSGNLNIFKNKIYNSNTTGLHVEVASHEGLVNAQSNWWGSPDGPSIFGIWEGSGENIIPPDQDSLIFFRPFCILEDCNEMSSLQIDPDDLEDNFTTGTFSIVGDDYTNTSQITVTEDLNISVNGDDGTSYITLENGTIITKSGGGNFNGSLLTASELDKSSITGLAHGDVVYGALNWGIPGLGLEFSSPITISIYVGSDLYNQTLSVKRSVDGVTWTSAGIVNPASCVVDPDGMCTFQASKASSYIGYDEYELPESPHSPVGNVGAISIAYNNPTPIGDGESSQTVGMGQTISVGTLSPEGLNLFSYINSVAHFKALHSSTYTYEEHTMTISDLDMAKDIVSFKIESDPQYFSLALGDEIQVDLDGDNIKDIKIKFTSLKVNRIEMTLKSLLTKTVNKTEDNSPINQTKLCTYTFTRNLSIGMSGADVKELQKCLNSLGYTLATVGAAAPGWETSFYGSLTKAGITRFQEANNLTATGILDNATRAKLNGNDEILNVAIGKYIFIRNLYLGMSGEDVKELQKFLNAHGYVVAVSGAGSIGNETFYYGYATRAAVIKFQKANNISPVGYVGALTRAALNK